MVSSKHADRRPASGTNATSLDADQPFGVEPRRRAATADHFAEQHFPRAR
jgi:hypothetical protein